MEKKSGILAWFKNNQEEAKLLESIGEKLRRTERERLQARNLLLQTSTLVSDTPHRKIMETPTKRIFLITNRDDQISRMLVRRHPIVSFVREK